MSDSPDISKYLYIGDPWEQCKQLKFENTTKWHMHKPESAQENETHRILWDFQIQTDHLILAKRPDVVIINTKKRELAF